VPVRRVGCIGGRNFGERLVVRPSSRPGSAGFLVAELAVAVQVLIEGLLGRPQRLTAGQDRLDGGHHRSAPCVPEKISRKNRNTFSTSRKIDAARNGAEVMSALVRSRWKSNMVNPAKMTRPSTE